MHIEEIIIDGFKSYAKRTVVTGFDQQFNAITGLNGSGKSNILDSICFVLGISKLEQVRAGSLQELVYKQGQAGVTRASVTVVFSNRDKKGSPVGYESYDEISVCRQVAIGGRNKYLINGHVAQQNKVQNLFHSVQLNVNNPHFLIMQGRITKVINMAPMEILGLIAEAAGTKMYESKKEAALKTIEKKQAKVEEIQKILDEDITPTLEKLRKERAAYMAWSSGNVEKERLERFCTAWDFSQAEETTNASSGQMKEMQDEMQGMETKIAELEQEKKSKHAEIKMLQSGKDAEMGGEVKELEDSATELSKGLVKASSAWQHCKENLASEVKALNKVKKSVTDLEKALNTNKSKVSKASDSVNAITDDVAKCTERLTELQRQRQGLQAGCDADSKEGEKSLADQLKDATTRVSTADTELKQQKKRLEHLKVELKERTKGAKSAGKEFEKLQAELNKAKSSVDVATKELEKLSVNPEEYKQLRADIAKEESSAATLRESVDRLSSKVSNAEVSYTAPHAKFDKSKVKGIVASLVKLKDKKTATALEVACGAKLYQLVVEDEETGKELLKNGQLKRRVTIIPLNKIESSTLSESTLKNAAKTVGDRGQLALQLVGYDDEVANAMRYALGKTMVCKDVDAAKTCAFTEGIRAKSVTMDGDVFDPAGTLTGGSRAPASNSILLTFGELMDKREELEKKESVLRELKSKASLLKTAAEKYAALEQKLEMAQHEAALTKKRLDMNPHFKAAEELREMEEEVTNGDSLMADKAKELKDSESEVQRLDKAIKEYTKSWDKLLEAKDKEIKKAKDDLASLQAKLKTTREQNEATLLESEAGEEEMKALQEQLAACEEGLKKCGEEAAELELVVAQKREIFESAEQKVKDKRNAIKQTDKDIAAASKECDKCDKKMEEVKISMKKLEHNMKQFDKESEDARKLVEHWLRQHPWIASERIHFGKPGGDYDWKAQDPVKAKKRYNELQGLQDSMGKKINKKVMGMFEKAEQEYQDVMEKKRIVENDKRKIEMVMDELDEKKNQALKTTWTKVNRDFSSIFHTLLPNAKSKLEPPEGGTVLDGLVMKVGFGDCWKDSLSELSGGQRSLLALSLILALLLFKPAPMYILDEIDAALDLSHTQNIGVMLKTHFKNSQFIIVSLKEGMFNNANVLYRTKFVDGVSTVLRTTPTAKP